ncbi:hypothetical protein E2C01_093384 [Portunus trituberculatus]|uniref:Uncharacterized protein n=1 Tax=Portunus trituberculatus TaxID=210409 RepID=A0A5B7K0D1_PORTR|nr:hypothetical protein [Portunus trituberculatus]
MRGASEVKVSQVTLPYLFAVQSDVITKVNTNRYYYTDLTPFSTGTHFYLEISVRLNHFIDIRKDLYRSED